MSDRSINPDDHNDINLSGSPQQGPPKQHGGHWIPFEEARELARGLGFTTNIEWKNYAKSGQKPNDIPRTPREVYKDEWRGWGDWLGTGTRRGSGWRPFEEARKFAQELGFKNVKEWGAYCRSGQKPDDIPAIASRVYKDSGWRGWGNWLGTGNVSTRRSFQPFEEAKEFARGLGIKSQREWVEYSKSGKLPTDIPSNPQQVYKDEFRGLGDWIGIINIWKRPALLAFLEDLRPHLERLEEAELYAIIAQSGAMRAFRIAFDGVDSPAPGGVIQDLKGNDGRGVEEAIKGISEEELQEAALPGGETPEEVLGPEMLTETLAEEDAPPEEYLTGENGGGLPELATPEGLRIVDELAALHYGLDDEAADFLVRNRVAALWSAYINEGPATAEAALAGEGGHYFGLIRSRFWEELRSVEELPIPGGWSFRPARVRIDSPPVPPNLMQKRTAYEVLTHKRVGNWSSVGTGKTIAAVLASRVANRKHTLIITNKATIGGWRREILSAYPDSVVHTEASNSNGSKGAHSYTILNYERFQLPSRGELVRKLAEAGVDFIVFDEVQLVKQRDQDASIRRKAVEGLVSLLSEHTEGDLHVLGLSATPVINNLLEARKLLEVVQGRSFADLDTQATAANAALRIADELRLREDLRVGDFGAGECLLRDALPNHDVVSLDYVALDEGVVACDMAHTPLEDGELGAAVFSLSLMGRNWRDYLAEAHRTLRPFGLVFIAEPARRWEDGVLEEALEGAGFDPLRTVRRGDFIYARGVKR